MAVKKWNDHLALKVAAPDFATLATRCKDAFELKCNAEFRLYYIPDPRNVSEQKDVRNDADLRRYKSIHNGPELMIYHEGDESPGNTPPGTKHEGSVDSRGSVSERASSVNTLVFSCLAS